MAREIEVRIAVAVDATGVFSAAAFGWSGGDKPMPSELRSRALDDLDETTDQPDAERSFVWITARVPVPEPAEIPGTVEAASGEE